MQNRLIADDSIKKYAGTTGKTEKTILSSRATGKEVKEATAQLIKKYGNMLRILSQK